MLVLRIQHLDKTRPGGSRFSVCPYLEEEGYTTSAWIRGEGVSNDRDYLRDMIELLKLDSLGDQVKVNFHYTHETREVWVMDVVRTSGK